MKIDLTLAEWCRFCDWIQATPEYRSHYTATLIPTREGTTYLDDHSELPVYTVTFTEESVYTHWVLQFGDATAAKRSAKDFE